MWNQTGKSNFCFKDRRFCPSNNYTATIFQELGKPRAEEPLKGFLVPNVELPCLCSSKFRPGPPSEQAQILTACVADFVKDVIDLQHLCISPDNLVWVLHADMICLDFDGSVGDACVTALVAALKTGIVFLSFHPCLYYFISTVTISSVAVKLPQVDYDVETKKIVVDDTIRKPLKVDCSPVSSTYAMFEE